MSSSTLVVDAAGPAGNAPKGARHRCRLQNSVLSDPPIVPPRGPAIDIFFNLSGGRCRTRQQCPPGVPSSMPPSNSVVDAAGPTGSTPQGGHHRCRLQTRWWTLSDPPTTPSSGSAIDVFFNLGPPSTSSSKLGGGRCRTHWQRPLGGSASTSCSNW
jgi:hypothetical protein